MRASRCSRVDACHHHRSDEDEDAAIPFDRVPYVPRDLRRVAIMASLMVVLILIAAVVVTRINP
jgi:hypothetical protein